VSSKCRLPKPKSSSKQLQTRKEQPLPKSNSVFPPIKNNTNLIKQYLLVNSRGFFLSKKTTQISLDKATAQKILRSFPYNQGFHFFNDVGKYTGETAIDLFAFYEKLKVIESESIAFHFPRGDFQKWIRETLEDSELADRIDKISPQKPVEKMKKDLVETVETRITELHTLARDPDAL
jgi:hypothetical protein